MATYRRYGPHAKVTDTKKISTSTWADNVNNLTTFFTSSTQGDMTDASSQGNFFVDVFNQPTSSISSSREFAISYGHAGGSGSEDFTADTGSFGFGGSRWIYHQYRQLVYGDENQKFEFEGTTPQDIFVINVERRNYKQNLKPGTLNLHLMSGSIDKIRLTDDSTTKTGSAVITNMGRQFNIVSGASGIMSGSVIAQTPSGSYGFLYPDAGFLILNARALRCTLGWDKGGGEATGSDITTSGNNLTPNETSNAKGYNVYKLLNAMETANTFILDSEEKVTSQYFFTRIRNHEFNYTGNPSFIDDKGTLRFSSMTDNPTTFITTVGLYNDNADLLAVAKLSRPLTKDFTKESLIRVKIDY